ncbi:MAG: PqqD family protein [Candidatus Omnitrophota bacterium]
MPKIEIDTCFKINKAKVSYRLINQEAVVLHLERGFYYSLNKTGTLIWQFIEQQRSLGEIIEYLGSKLEIGAEELKNDAISLLCDLEKEELILKMNYAH